MYRIALYNWIRSQPRRFGTHRFNNPKSPADIGIFPTPEDTALESPRHIKVSDVSMDLKTHQEGLKNPVIVGKR